jgi:hypothetical protein
MVSANNDRGRIKEGKRLRGRISVSFCSVLFNFACSSREDITAVLQVPCTNPALQYMEYIKVVG